jgi:AcrR family transcriptional regulator
MTKEAALPTGTRARLLAAAERLLLTEGYDDVSVRRICAEAGANPAAVHYHFGSKEALVAALLQERLGSLWEDKLSRLTAAHSSVVEIIDVVIEPFVELSADPVGRLHLRLLAQFVLGRHIVDWQRPWFRMDPWVDLLPEVSPQESRRRWMLAFDLIVVQFGGAGERKMSREAVGSLRSFVVAGLTASGGGTR